MSAREIQELRASLDSLRSEFAALSTVVSELREQVSHLSVQSDSEPWIPVQPESSSAQPASQASSAGYSVITTESPPFIAASDKEGRAELARQIGRFFKDSVAGRYTGTSGRDRLQLRSRLYVALVDYHGVRFPKPKIYRDFDFSSLAAACKRGPSVGQSVFVGFATEWEPRLALEEVEFPWPLPESDGR